MKIGGTLLWMGIIVAAPTLALVAVVLVWRWRLERRVEHVPIAEKLLRPAGESLRLRNEKLDEKLMESFFLCIVAPLLGGVVLLVPTAVNATVRLVYAFVFSVSAFVLSVTRLFFGSCMNCGTVASAFLGNAQLHRKSINSCATVAVSFTTFQWNRMETSIT
jgi:H+/gluconate symporter-like permease